jgi:hypothetical protein
MVRYHPAAVAEERALPSRERVAMANAAAKLQAAGPALGFPHQSAVQGTDLRELRPRAGRSPWRGLYQRIGDEFVIGAIAPEAMVDRRGFDQAVRRCQDRLAEVEESG